MRLAEKVGAVLAALLFSLLIFLLARALPSRAELTPTQGGDAQEPCLKCHNQRDLSLTLANGEKLPLFFDAQALAASVHGSKLFCTDCHPQITGYPHARWQIPSRRDYSLVQYETCKRCHFLNYTKTLDSLHFTMLSQGNTKAPICVDCHGYHDTTPPDKPRSQISQTCAKCHQAIYQTYLTSVHGTALVTEDNREVPVCTDCHSSHNIEDPRTPTFHVRSVDLCARCHTDEKIAAKYSLSTQVLKTYLEDFHGATVAGLSRGNKDIWPTRPVCTDCHGVHAIRATEGLDFAAMKANLKGTCLRCHSQAPDFPSAWLSHYALTPEEAPLFRYVRQFYLIAIALLLIGLVSHMWLDFWRFITNR